MHRTARLMPPWLRATAAGGLASAGPLPPHGTHFPFAPAVARARCRVPEGPLGTAPAPAPPCTARAAAPAPVCWASMPRTPLRRVARTACAARPQRARRLRAPAPLPPRHCAAPAVVPRARPGCTSVTHHPSDPAPLLQAWHCARHRPPPGPPAAVAQRRGAPWPSAARLPPPPPQGGPLTLCRICLLPAAALCATAAVSLARMRGTVRAQSGRSRRVGSGAAARQPGTDSHTRALRRVFLYQLLSWRHFLSAPGPRWAAQRIPSRMSVPTGMWRPSQVLRGGWLVECDLLYAPTTDTECRCGPAGRGRNPNRSLQGAPRCAAPTTPRPPRPSPTTRPSTCSPCSPPVSLGPDHSTCSSGISCRSALWGGAQGARCCSGLPALRHARGSNRACAHSPGLPACRKNTPQLPCPAAARPKPRGGRVTAAADSSHHRDHRAPPPCGRPGRRRPACSRAEPKLRRARRR